MQKKSDKKMVITLLIVLAIVIIGSGIWTYNNMKPLANSGDNFSDIQIDEVFKIKDEAIKNVTDFLDVDSSPGTVWDDFYNDPQFHRLEDNNINIDINKNVGNPSPFTAPTSTDDGKETEN